MSRQFFGFRTLSLVILAAGLSAGCDTIYSDVYSPKRNRFVAPVERTVVTELPPETTTTTTTVLPPATPIEMTPAPAAMPDAAAAPAVPGLEPIPGMEAVPAAPADPAMGADPTMGAAPADPAAGM